ncbi:toxin glutamine deamidase domain-containing protein [Actinoplanes sp. NEAU-A12]|uniref:Toxin glutamine deamidase domain-containing protein n=1 Tax=Actinoplanes sandaracinus TaxID=3045177 RepID=A0ABT6WBF7_9ACTN|nr:toxin glutamine deamidase domain-containing protein [Actinoplanes sandaracinus]MDI6097071.1 toxin glutamine deamidase domain-containing protein [Actinoplanes sandaracinus]
MTILPSPIPHPLDFSPWDLPGWVYEGLEWVVGFDWPEGNEKATWDLADQWYDLVNAMAAPREDAAEAAGRFITAYGGGGTTIDAFIAAWKAVADSDEAPLNALLDFATEMGKVVEECGADIEAAKLEAWIELGIFVVELIGLSITVALTLGAASPAAAGIVAATRMAIQQIFKRLVAQLSRKAMKEALKDAGKRVASDVFTKKGLANLGKQALKEGRSEAREEFLTNLGIQSYQTAVGHTDGINLGDLGMSTLAGAAGGVSAHGASIGAGQKSGLLRGAAAEVFGELGGSAVTGDLPGFEELAKAGTSGAAGAAVGNTRQSFQDMGAGLDGDLSLNGLPSASSSSSNSTSSGTDVRSAFPGLSPGDGSSGGVATSNGGSSDGGSSGNGSSNGSSDGGSAGSGFSNGSSSTSSPVVTSSVSSSADSSSPVSSSPVSSSPVSSTFVSSPAADTSVTTVTPSPAGHVADTASAVTGQSTTPTPSETVQAPSTGTRPTDVTTPAPSGVTLSSVAPPVDAPAHTGANTGGPASSPVSTSVNPSPAGNTAAGSPVAFAPNTGTTGPVGTPSVTVPSVTAPAVGSPSVGSPSPNVSLAGSGPATMSAPGLTSPSTSGVSPTGPSPGVTSPQSLDTGGTRANGPAISTTASPAPTGPAPTSATSPAGTPATASPGRPEVTVPAQPNPVTPGGQTNPPASAPSQPGPTDQRPAPPHQARTDPGRPDQQPLAGTAPIPFTLPPRSPKDNGDELQYFDQYGKNKKLVLDRIRVTTLQDLSQQISDARFKEQRARRNVIKATLTLNFSDRDLFRREVADLQKQEHDASQYRAYLLADPSHYPPGQHALTDPQDFLRANKDVGALSDLPIWSNDQSALTGGGNPPNSRTRRKYQQWGGLREPLRVHQADLERAVPRDQNLVPVRTPDPRAPWLGLMNDGGSAADPTRGVNCLDCSLSFYETYLHGRPTVAAPRTVDTYGVGEIDQHVGEFDGHFRAELATGSGFTEVTPSVAHKSPADAKADIDQAFVRIATTLLQGGHGSTAIIINQWEGGGWHAWNAVNHHGTLLFLDPQSGEYSDATNFTGGGPGQHRTLYGHAGTPHGSNVVTVNALMVDGQGNPMAVPNTPPAPLFSGRTNPPPPPLAYQRQQAMLQQQANHQTAVTTQPSPAPPVTPAPPPAPPINPAPPPAPPINPAPPPGPPVNTQPSPGPHVNPQPPAPGPQVTPLQAQTPVPPAPQPQTPSPSTSPSPSVQQPSTAEPTIQQSTADNGLSEAEPGNDSSARTPESQTSRPADPAPSRPALDLLAVLDPESMNAPRDGDPLAALDPANDVSLAVTTQTPAPQPEASPDTAEMRDAAEQRAREDYRYETARARQDFDDAHRQRLARDLRQQADARRDQVDRLSEALRAADARGDEAAADRYAADRRQAESEAEHLKDRAAAVEQGGSTGDVELTGDDWERVNESSSELAPGPVETGDRSALTGDDGPRPVDTSRRYHQRGGLRPPLLIHQTDLERAMPRDPDGNVTRQADPRDGRWFGLMNDGGPEADPTRSLNCGDTVLSLFDTYMHGRPRVSAPRTFDGYSDGEPTRPTGAEQGVSARIESTTGGRFEGLSDVSGLDPQDARAEMRLAESRIRNHLLGLGHGSFAFITTQDQAGRTHAFAAVNQNGTVLYLDPQTRAVSANVPMHTHSGTGAPSDVVRMDALTVDGQARHRPLTAGYTPLITADPAGDPDPGTGYLPEGYSSSPALKHDPYHPDTVTVRHDRHMELYGPSIQDRAAALGYTTRIPAQRAPFNSHGQVVFSDGRSYITPDVDGHNVSSGWKKFNRKGQRIGTYDAELNYIKE